MAGAPPRAPQVIGGSGVLRNWPEGPKSPANQKVTPRPLQLRTSGFTQLLDYPCKGFSSFCVGIKAQTLVLDKQNPPNLEAQIRFRVYSRQIGNDRLIINRRLSCPYETPGFTIYEVADALTVWAALTDPATSGVYYPAIIKVSITGLA